MIVAILALGVLVYLNQERLPLLRGLAGARPSFDSEAWKKSGVPYGVIGERLHMVDELLDSRRLIGKAREDVVALLGESDGDPAARSTFPGWHLYYYLGPSRGTMLFKSFDYDYLVVRLDAKGRVTTARIVTLKT